MIQPPDGFTLVGADVDSQGFDSSEQLKLAISFESL
jgi:hypothetical protein